MKPKLKRVLTAFVPETLLYGGAAAAFCYGTARILGKPLVDLSRSHRVEYALIALALVIFQGFVLERIVHAVCSLFIPQEKEEP
jgi:hypothetical protein